MSSAMSMMAGNSAGAAAGLTNRLSMAVGGYRGQAAIAAGYTHNARAISVNLGVSATGRDVMSGGSLGFAW
jgi:autotransporter adhesin